MYFLCCSILVLQCPKDLLVYYIILVDLTMTFHEKNPRITRNVTNLIFRSYQRVFSLYAYEVKILKSTSRTVIYKCVFPFLITRFFLFRLLFWFF